MAAQGDSTSVKEEVIEKRGDGATGRRSRVDCSSSANIIISVQLTVGSMPARGVKLDEQKMTEYKAEWLK